jgi:hypothetical protein
MPFSLDQELSHDKPSGSLTQVHSDSSGKCLSNLAWTFDHWGPSIPDTQVLEKNKTHYNINYPSHKVHKNERNYGSVWYAKYKNWTEQHKAVQDRTAHDKRLRFWTNFVLCDVLWSKGYFGILDNLCWGQKVVMWFCGGQEFQFLCCPLAPSLSSTRNSFEIKHNTIKVVMFSPLFFSRSNILYMQLETFMRSATMWCFCPCYRFWTLFPAFIKPFIEHGILSCLLPCIHHFILFILSKCRSYPR